MRKIGRWHVAIVLTVLMAVGLWACGGGGDSDSDSGNNTSGPTNTVDAGTVDEIISDLDDLGIGCSAGGASLTSSGIVGTLRALGEKASEKVRTGFEERRMLDAMGVLEPQEPLVLEDTCPGSDGQITIQISVDDETGEFNGTVAIVNFCIENDASEQATIVGGLSFNGQMVTDSEGMLTSLTFNASTTSPVAITSTTGDSASIILSGFTFTLTQATDGSGSISVAWTALDVDIVDGGESEFIDTDNVAIGVAVDAAGAVTITLQGQITTNDGSLIISTPTPITVDASGNITGGVIQIDGAEGTGIQITYTGTGYIFTVTADTDGDGSYDDYNEDVDCTELGDDLSDTTL